MELTTNNKHGFHETPGQGHIFWMVLNHDIHDVGVKHDGRAQSRNPFPRLRFFSGEIFGFCFVYRR